MNDHEILDQESRHGRTGWFMRGFVSALALAAIFLYFTGYFGSAETSDLGMPKTIIEGR